METELFHDSLNEAPFYSVKSLAHVELDCHISVISIPFVFEIMHYFKSSKNIVCDQSFRQKCALVLYDNFGKDGLKPICKHFCNELVNHVA